MDRFPLGVQTEWTYERRHMFVLLDTPTDETLQKYLPHIQHPATCIPGDVCEATVVFKVRGQFDTASAGPSQRLFGGKWLPRCPLTLRP